MSALRLKTRQGFQQQLTIAIDVAQTRRRQPVHAHGSLEFAELDALAEGLVEPDRLVGQKLQVGKASFRFIPFSGEGRYPICECTSARERRQGWRAYGQNATMRQQQSVAVAARWGEQERRDGS